jgi:hypothetical protein
MPIIPTDLPDFLSSRTTGVVAFDPHGLDVHWRVASGPAFSPDVRIRELFPKHVTQLHEQDRGETLARVHRFHRDGKALKLRTDGISWREVCALRKCVEESKLGDSLTREDLLQPNYGLIGGMSLRLAVLDNEGQLGMPLRSKTMATYANQWSIGLLEGIRLDDVQTGALQAVAHRVLAEELGISDPPESTFTTLGLLVDAQLYQWCFLGVMDFRGQGPQFSEGELIQSQRKAPDRWEARNLAFIEPNVESLDLLEQVSKHRAYPCARDELQLLSAYLNRSSQ